MARPLALAAALAVSLLAVAGAGGAATQQAPKHGGTVIVGLPANLEPACFNVWIGPCLQPSPFVTLPFVEDLVFARPFLSRPDLTFRPDLVSKVELTNTPPFTITFHIHPKARWSDGRPVTAYDWSFSHRALLASEALRARYEGPPPYWILSARISVLDAKTLRMQFPSRDGFGLVKKSFRWGIPPRHIIRDPDRSSPSFWRDTIMDPKTGKPIASGPFLMASRKRGHSITLVRNPRYWGKHTAYVDKLVFRFLRPDELGDALRRGEIHVVQGSTLIGDDLIRDPPREVKVVATRGVFLEHLAIRVGPSGHPALENKLVRRALAYGINRTRLLRTIDERFFRGTGAPRVTPLESVVHLAQHPSYEPTWERYDYRPARARRLLARAGCRIVESERIRVCGSERLSLRIGTTAGTEVREHTLAFVREQLLGIGIEVRPVYYPSVNGLVAAFADGQLDLGLWAWNYGHLNISAPGGLYRCGGDSGTGHCSRLATRELDNADRTRDDQSRALALNRADALLAQDVPVLPLYQVPAYVAYRTSLRIPELDPNDPLWNAENWWLDR